MSKTLPDFVSDEPVSTPAAEAPASTPAEAAPSTETAPEPPPAAKEASPGQPRGADGKFAPVAPPPEAAAAPAAVEAPPVAPPAPPAPEAPPPVPLATALEWRERMTAAEKRAKELEDWRTQQEAQARRQPVPTFEENPAAAVAHQQQQIQAAIFETRRDFSRQVAEMRHGKENVDAAYSWAESLIDQQLRQTGRSALNDDLVRHPDPVAFVVEQWRRDQIAAKVDPTKFEAFLTWEAAQAAAAQAPAHQPVTAAPAVAPPAPPAAPRPSLAAAPSAASSGAPIPRDGASTYGAMFGT